MFEIGARVLKYTGNYVATGTIKASFIADDGTPRYVFQFDVPKGLLHIFAGPQLRALDDREQTHGNAVEASRKTASDEGGP